VSVFLEVEKEKVRQSTDPKEEGLPAYGEIADLLRVNY